jgi:hypothetical protein
LNKIQGSQGIHDSEALFDINPLSHFKHFEEELDEYVPAGHSMHELEPFENIPAGQLAQISSY